MSVPGVSLILSMVSPLVLVFAYGISLTLSVVPLSMSAPTYVIPQTLSGITSSISVSDHGVPSLGVHPSSMIPPCVDAQLARLIIFLIASSTNIFSND